MDGKYLLAAILLFPLQLRADTGIGVGVILPLTGPVAEYGVAARNGIELAVEKNPSQLKNIKFLFEDSRYDSATALTIFEKFRLDPNIKLMLVWGFGPAQAVAPVAESRKYPIFVVSGERTISKDKKYVVRFSYYAEQVAKVTAEYLHEQNLNRLAMIKTELAFNNSVYDGMKNNLAPGATMDLVGEYEMGQIDFRPTLLKLRGANYDAVGAFLAGNQISQFYKQMAELQMHLTTFGTDYFEGTQEVRLAGPAIIGTVFAGPYVDPKFAEEYTHRFDSDSQVSWAANSYEFALLVGRVLGTPGNSDESEPILSRFRGLGRQLGVTGPYEFSESPAGPAFEFSVVPKRVTGKGIENIQVILPGEPVPPQPPSDKGQPDVPHADKAAG